MLSISNLIGSLAGRQQPPAPSTKADEAAPAPPPHTGASDAVTPQATPDELRAALLGIGVRRIMGATWQEAAEDERWAELKFFLHCERDKLDGGSSDDVDGLYLSEEEAEAAASESPQANDSRVWKVYVATAKPRYLITDRKAMHHFVRAIKKELFALPQGECPGTPVELLGYREEMKAWLDSAGQNIVLFEDENVLNGDTYNKTAQTGGFRTDSGAGLFDYQGAILLPARFEDIKSFYSGLAAAKLNGLWGFVDRNGHWQIEPGFLELGVLPFYSGDDAYARVRTDNGWGLIDRHGKLIVTDRYAAIGRVDQYRGGLSIAAVRKEKNGLWGAIAVSGAVTTATDAAAQQNEVAETASVADEERLVVDCICETEDDVKKRVHAYLESLTQKRESVSRLHDESAEVDYHCNYCARKIGDYDALRAAGFHVDKHDRVYCSDACSTKAFMGASRDYESRGGDY